MENTSPSGKNNLVRTERSESTPFFKNNLKKTHSNSVELVGFVALGV